MSDGLVKRLRSVPPCNGCGEYPGGDIAQIMDIAADRIEELEAANRGLVRLNEATEARAKTAEAKLETAVEALTQIERAYYQEATNPSPETVRRMAARMNGIARDAQNALAELTGGPKNGNE